MTNTPWKPTTAGAAGAVEPGRPAVGLVVHSGRAETRAAASDAVDHLRARGARVIACADDEWSAEGVQVRAADDFAEGLDVVVVLGGDGTFLRAAHLTRRHSVPLVGVNLGRLGFLSEVEAEGLPGALDRLVDGDYGIEERMSLTVDVVDRDGSVVDTTWALNEASVERAGQQRLIVLEVLIGDVPFHQIPADAVILATPTGSTAYAFSAGGPILSPLVDAILVVPVAPHSLFSRTVVVDPAESLSVRPTDPAATCAVSCDGRETLLVPPGGRVRVARGERPVRLARLRPFDFYARVREKFHLH